MLNIYAIISKVIMWHLFILNYILKLQDIIFSISVRHLKYCHIDSFYTISIYGLRYIKIFIILSNIKYHYILDYSHRIFDARERTAVVL